MNDYHLRVSVLIIKNVVSEGPGTIAHFLSEHGINFTIVEAGAGEDVPSLEGYKYLVVLGGPMGVYEMDKYPFLRKVAQRMEEALRKGVKILGICLGAQLLAHVLGSRVYPGGTQEIGWLDIKAVDYGMSDEVFRNLIDHSGRATVLQWHGDTYDLPSGALRLASSELFPEQAFRYNSSYALQFHIEVTPEMIKDWFSQREDFELIVKKTKLFYPNYRLRAELFYKSFFGEIIKA